MPTGRIRGLGASARDAEAFLGRFESTHHGSLASRQSPSCGKWSVRLLRGLSGVSGLSDRRDGRRRRDIHLEDGGARTVNHLGLGGVVWSGANCAARRDELPRLKSRAVFMLGRTTRYRTSTCGSRDGRYSGALKNTSL